MRTVEASSDLLGREGFIACLEFHPACNGLFPRENKDVLDKGMEVKHTH